MKEFLGKSVSKGIAIGNMKYMAPKHPTVNKVTIQDTEAEIARFEAAKKEAISDLQKLYQSAVLKVGKQHAAIFDIHAMLLEDINFNNSIVEMISNQKVNAEYAVWTAGERLVGMFAGMEDASFQTKSADVKDISERVIRILQGADASNEFGDEPVILVAEDLSPSETVQMNKENILSFVTRYGSAGSHTAILARTMEIPALVGVEFDAGDSGYLCVVDGYEGKLIVDPDEEVLKTYRSKKQVDDESKSLLMELKGKENITKSGRKIRLYANIGKPEDLDAVFQNDADGIGLFRSEFLFLDKTDYPTEDEQFEAYKKVVESMDGKKVIIRTMDIGADKQVDYFHLDKEDNPALGCRAIRICLSRPEIFKTQLRAIYRASAYGNLSIMYPMIISEEEVIKIKEISRSVRDELIAEGFPIGKVEEGIMIETPAAAIISDKLAQMVDFFSIGTNDLSQYTLAIDRGNDKLDEFFDPYHPALFHLIQMVIENGHKAGIWVGICGELGADTQMTATFIKMGIDELSVAPGAVLSVRKAIRETE